MNEEEIGDIELLNEWITNIACLTSSSKVGQMYSFASCNIWNEVGMDD